MTHSEFEAQGNKNLNKNVCGAVQVLYRMVGPGRVGSDQGEKCSWSDWENWRNHRADRHQSHAAERNMEKLLTGAGAGSDPGGTV